MVLENLEAEDILDNRVNSRFENGESLLHVACIAQHAECVTYLSSLGADQQSLDSQGRTAIDVSLSPRIQKILQPVRETQTFAKQVPTLYDKEVIFEMASISAQTDELLYKLQLFQFDVNGEENPDGDYLLHIATKEGLSQLELLLSLVRHHKANINITNKEGMTPLMLSAEIGDQVIADMMMVVLGASPNYRNPINGSTALHYCCAFNHLDTASVLLKRGADFNLEDEQGMRPDDVAVRCRNQESAELIISHRHQRCELLNEEINCDTLSDTNVRETDLVTTDAEGFTLLMMAARGNKLHTLRYLLTKANTPVDAQHEKTLMTALSYAAVNGSTEAVTLLMKHRSNPTITDINRLLPIHHAVKAGHAHVVHELLRHASAFTGLQKSLELAEGNPWIISTIRKAVEKRQREIVMPLLFECAISGNAEKLFNTLEFGDDVNIASDFGQWPLMLAVENGHLQVANLLIEHGADLHQRIRPGNMTLLHLASARGHPEVVLRLLQLYQEQEGPPLPCLLPGPASTVNEVDDKGRSAVVLAAEHGHVKTLSLLLNNGASPSCSTTQGALYRCKDYDGCQAIIELHRTRHLAKVLGGLVKKGNIRALQQVFVPQLDHHLRTSTGDTPLMVACYYNNITAIRHLVKSAFYCLTLPRSVSDTQVSDKSQSTASISGYDSGTCLDTLDSGEDKRGIVIEGQEGQDNEKLNTREHEDSHSFQTDDEPKISKPVLIVEGSVTQLGEHFYIGTSNATATIRNRELYVNETTPVEEMAEMWFPGVSELPAEDDYERTVLYNVAKLFETVAAHEMRSSIFLTDILISHLCATNPADGATCFHRLVQSGDHPVMLEVLLRVDASGINIQDKKGWSPLHLAVYLKRRKIVERLLQEPFIDMEIRTLDGFLPEEMTTDKKLRKLFTELHDSSSKGTTNPFASFVSFLTTSHSFSQLSSEVDFDELNKKYEQVKQSNPRIPDVQDQSAAMYSWM